MRLAPIAFVSLLPGLAFSATLPAPSAEYRAEAAISVHVTQAVFSDGRDASASVQVRYYHDDYFLIDEGAVVFGDVSDNLYDALYSSEKPATLDTSSPYRASVGIRGAVSPSERAQGGYLDLNFEPEFVYFCEEEPCVGEDISISFSYEVDSSEVVIISDPMTTSAYAGASASLAIHSAGLALQSLLVFEGSGRFRTTLSPGEGLIMAMNLAASGEATYTSPQTAVIPLPASGVVLAGGLALLGGMATARKRKAGRVPEGDAA